MLSFYSIEDRDNGFYIMSINNNKTDFSASTTAPHVQDSTTSHAPENLDDILDIIFICLSGLAIVVALAVLIYSALAVFNKYWCCCDCLDLQNVAEEDEEEGDVAEEVHDTGPSAEAFGPVAFKARLWGLTTSERRAILEEVFAKKTTIYETLGKERSRRSNITAKESGVDTKSTCTSDLSNKEELSRLGSESDEMDDNNNVEIDVDSFVLDQRNTCAICLGDYEQGERVLQGIFCNHQYHFNCIMKWMQKCNDHCPYCRAEMMKPQLLRCAAKKLLSKARLEELSWERKSPTVNRASDMTDSPLSNVSDAVDQHRSVSPHLLVIGIPSRNQLQPASPALSDQAQLGHRTAATPDDDINTPSSTGTPSQDNASRLEAIRESLDQRLTTSSEIGSAQEPVTAEENDK